MSKYDGLLIKGEAMNFIAIASSEDRWVTESLDRDGWNIGEETFEKLSEIATESDYGGPFISIGALSLEDLKDVNENLFDSMSSEDIEAML